MTGARVLVVDDDPTITDVLARYLHREGYVVATAGDGVSALDLARQSHPHLVVLDIMLPGTDGLEVARQLRTFSAAPIVLLTALGETEDRIAGFEVGADDYVVKPFSPHELVLRITAILRRTGTESTATKPIPALVDGDLRVDHTARMATLGGNDLALTIREYDLLVHFMRHPREVITRERLLADVWGWSFGDTSTVTVHVKRLRAKMSDTGEDPRIATVRGVGYRFDPLAPAVESTAGAEPAGTEAVSPDSATDSTS